MNDLQEVLVLENESPSAAPDKFNFFRWNIFADPENGVLHAMKTGDRGNLLKARRRFLDIVNLVQRRRGVNPLLIELPAS